jgi:DNA-binding LacI/PurR family transcriptional regulator
MTVPADFLGRAGSGAESGAGPGTGPTIEDVARRAAVSRQTVSNAINAPHRVHDQTLARVRLAIEELGYRPNRVARSLRRRATRLIGYRIQPVAHDAISPVLDRFLHALADASREQGYHLLLFTPADEADEMATYDEMMSSATVDGFVLSGTDHHDLRPKRLHDARVPFVCFGRTDHDEGHAWVDVDGAAGTAAAVEHLIQRGHRRIAFLGWPEGSGTGDARAEGWRRALAAHGIGAGGAEAPILRSVDGPEHGGAMITRLLDAAEPPTAVVCASDALALGAMFAAVARGLEVGRELAVVGFDDAPTAALVRPGLTSLRQPLEEVGRRVADLLVAQLEGRQAGANDGTGNPDGGVLLPPTLVVRESS